MELGCTRSDDHMVCPYVYSKWPSTFESSSYVSTTRADAPIRLRPRASAKILRLARFEVLKLDTIRQQTGWYVVESGPNTYGYVSKSDARSPIDYRAEFQKTPKGWKLIYFIAGD